GRYDPVGITIPPNNTLLITHIREIEEFLLFLFIGKKKKRKSKILLPSSRVYCRGGLWSARWPWVEWVGASII
ncbi:MAG: hypothetical protein J6Q28_05860, partial [Alistipes sp.]|nr:hypothetical protein [Alistipes sp.]